MKKTHLELLALFLTVFLTDINAQSKNKLFYNEMLKVNGYGPWLIFGDHGGSANPLREGKFTTFEGGQRVPCLMKWPQKIPASSECSEIVSTLDLLPTVAKITNSKLPSNKIDGHNIQKLMLGKKIQKVRLTLFTTTGVGILKL